MNTSPSRGSIVREIAHHFEEKIEEERRKSLTLFTKSPPDSRRSLSGSYSFLSKTPVQKTKSLGISPTHERFKKKPMIITEETDFDERRKSIIDSISSEATEELSNMLKRRRLSFQRFSEATALKLEDGSIRSTPHIRNYKSKSVVTTPSRRNNVRLSLEDILIEAIVPENNNITVDKDKIHVENVEELNKMVLRHRASIEKGLEILHNLNNNEVKSDNMDTNIDLTEDKLIELRSLKKLEDFVSYEKKRNASVASSVYYQTFIEDIDVDDLSDGEGESDDEEGYVQIRRASGTSVNLLQEAIYGEIDDVITFVEKSISRESSMHSVALNKVIAAAFQENVSSGESESNIMKQGRRNQQSIHEEKDISSDESPHNRSKSRSPVVELGDDKKMRTRGANTVPLPDSTIREGYIIKSGKGSGQWKKRWCAIESVTLRYYKSKGDKKAKGEITLEGATIRQTMDVHIIKPPLPFNFQIIDHKKRCWTLCFESDVEMLSWHKSLSESTKVLQDETIYIPRSMSVVEQTKTTTPRPSSVTSRILLSPRKPLLGLTAGSASLSAISFAKAKAAMKEMEAKEEINSKGESVDKTESESSNKSSIDSARPRVGTAGGDLEKEALSPESSKDSSRSKRSTIIKEGKAYKRTRWGKDYQSRWIRLYPNVLYYFTCYEDAVKGNIKGSVELDDSVHNFSDKDSSGNFPFTIVTSKRTYYFYVEKETDSFSWREGLNRAKEQRDIAGK